MARHRLKLDPPMGVAPRVPIYRGHKSYPQSQCCKPLGAVASLPAVMNLIPRDDFASHWVQLSFCMRYMFDPTFEHCAQYALTFRGHESYPQNESFPHNGGSCYCTSCKLYSQLPYILE